VLPHWGRWRLCDIRPSDVDDWIAGLSDRMGPISVRHCYTLFRGPIRRAVKDQIIPDPLIDIVLPPKPKIRKGFDDVLSGTEVRCLVESVADTTPGYQSLKTNGRYTALILMGCWLGPRWNEAIGVRVCDLNPLRKEISFGRVIVNQNGSELFQERLNKTEEYRTIPVPGEVTVSCRRPRGSAACQTTLMPPSERSCQWSSMPDDRVRVFLLWPCIAVSLRDVAADGHTCAKCGEGERPGK